MNVRAMSSGELLVIEIGQGYAELLSDDFSYVRQTLVCRLVDLEFNFAATTCDKLQFVVVTQA